MDKFKSLCEKVLGGETKAVELSGKAGKEILDLLKKAFASEWSAYYQYWLGAQVAQGNMRPSIAAELELHAGEEFAHAKVLSDRIVALGGIPTLAPGDWDSASPCKFALPSDRSVGAILKQNLEGERCAIVFYKKILDLSKETDDVTYDLVVKIMGKEQEHETDLVKLLADLEK